MVAQTVQRETPMLFRRRGRTDRGSEVTGLCEAHSQHISILSPAYTHPGTLVVAVPLPAAHLGHMRNCSTLPFL